MKVGKYFKTDTFFAKSNKVARSNSSSFDKKSAIRRHVRKWQRKITFCVRRELEGIEGFLLYIL